MGTESVGGSKYLVTFIDDYSRCCKVYCMRNKVLEKFKQFEGTYTNDCGQRIGTLRSDNGGEYFSKAFVDYLKVKGIRHESSVPYTPQQNGVAERKNQTLIESARTMLAHAGLPNKYWAEAVNVAAYVGNRVMTSADKTGKTPFEKWYGRKPNLSRMRVFGCAAYAHVPDSLRQKLDKKAVKLRFVGYADCSKGYRLIDENGKVIIRRDVQFNETDFGRESVQIENKVREEAVDESDLQESGVPSSSGRSRRPPVRFGYDEYADLSVVCHVAYSCGISEPQTLAEALSSQHAKQWKESADQEYESLMENETWDLVELPPNRQPVGCKWVFKVKQGSDGKADRFKGRLVPKGYSQRYGMDYTETFSPFVRFAFIRSLVALAVQSEMELHQMYMETAFLNGRLEEEVYMTQPEGYEVPGKDHLVCKLKKSLYGLKQSPRCWNYVFSDYMKQLGFTQGAADPCVFTRKKNDSLMLIAVYVDDVILAAKTAEEMSSIKELLQSKFKMKDIGKLHFILGINVVLGKESVSLHQSSYIENMLTRFGMADSNPVATPADTNVKLLENDGVNKSVDKVAY